jgi:hypothetical protein
MKPLRLWLAFLLFGFARIGTAYGQITPTDEIQGYDAAIVEQGKFNLTWHNNYTPIGQTQPEFPGGIVANHTLNGVPEWAYGVTDWFEAGMYLPVYSLTNNGSFLIDSAKLRALFVVPHADDRSFFYGLNFELSYNSKRWEPTRFSGEIRPIIGVRFGPVDIIINPILDTTFQGVKNLEFNPAERVAYNVSSTWAFAVEHYESYGHISGFLTPNEQDQTLFGVVDYKGPISVEAGIGHGFTPVGDKLVLKLILSRDF